MEAVESDLEVKWRTRVLDLGIERREKLTVVSKEQCARPL